MTIRKSHFLVLTVLALGLCSGPLARAQSLGGGAVSTEPNALIEASLYASQARKSFGCKVASTWAKKAIHSARRFRSHRQSERDTAAALIESGNVFLQRNQRRQNYLKHEAGVVSRLIRQRRVESALAVIQQANPPRCDAKVDSMRAKAKRQAGEARELESRGRRVSARAPGAALRLFQRAQQLDVELPNLDAEIVSARAAVRARRSETLRRWGRRTAYAILVGATAAALGAAAYYESRQANQQNSGELQNRR